MADFQLNKAKCVTALLFICNRLGGEWDKYSLLKILYFAEEKHLLKYGRSITGDSIIAMKHGPVPSYCLDKVKSSPQNEKYFIIDEDDVVKAQQPPNLDYLSKSDINCLEESIAENSHLNFGELKKKSHNEAYNKTVEKKGLNSTISYIEIAKGLGASRELIHYIGERIDFKEWE